MKNNNTIKNARKREFIRFDSFHSMNKAIDNQKCIDIQSDSTLDETSQLSDSDNENDDIEIVFERNNNSNDIYIDINDSTSKEEIINIQEKYERMNKNNKSSKLSQELRKPTLKINDKFYDQMKDNEDSIIISFENSNDNKSLTELMIDQNSVSSINSNLSLISESNNNHMKSNQMKKPQKKKN
eukprot:jgi/Orpsp1_1/1176679/evm.model.c7180000058575.1